MPSTSAYHAPVLASEVTELLRSSERVLDCTLGGGGHSLALLEAGVQTVIGVDRDPRRAGRGQRPGCTISRWLAGSLAVQSNYADHRRAAVAGRRAPSTASCSTSASRRIRSTTTERGFTLSPRRASRHAHGVGCPARRRRLLEQADESNAHDDLQELRRRAARRASRARDRAAPRQSRPFETSDDLVGAIRAVLGPRSGAAEFARLFQARSHRRERRASRARARASGAARSA